DAFPICLRGHDVPGHVRQRGPLPRHDRPDLEGHPLRPQLRRLGQLRPVQAVRQVRIRRPRPRARLGHRRPGADPRLEPRVHHQRPRHRPEPAAPARHQLRPRHHHRRPHRIGVRVHGRPARHARRAQRRRHRLADADAGLARQEPRQPRPHRAPAVRAAEGGRLMPLLDTLADDFDDGTVDPAKWPNAYGGVTETGGRAVVPCDTGYAAYASDTTYTLAGSHVLVQMWPPAAGGAATEAWAQVLVTSSTAGTDVVFEVNAIAGLLVMANRTGYFDPDAVQIAYDPADHRWLRMSEAAGTLVWETSPDGLAWTVQRTETAPAWLADADLQLQLISHRSDGTPDVAEFDNLNLPPDPPAPSTAVFADLTDDFAAPTVDTVKWPNNYNTGPGGALPDQPDGRARVPCGEGFAAYASDTIYRLQGSHAHVQLTPPPAAGHLEAYAQLLILSDTSGTQIVFEVDAVTNLLLMAVHVDYNDDNVFTLPYDPVAHAWLRIRESASILAWDTSPDGREWITRHTAPAPAWTSQNNLSVQLLTHCSPLVTGAPAPGGYAYFDNFNITPTLPAGYTVAVDWAGDGDYDGPYDDVTADVLERGPVSFSYGRDQARQLAPPK